MRDVVNLTAQSLCTIVFEFDPIYLDGASIRLVKSAKNMGDCTLAATCVANETDSAECGHFEVHSLQHWHWVSSVSQRQIFDRDVTESDLLVKKRGLANVQGRLLVNWQEYIAGSDLSLLDRWQSS